MGEIVNLFSQFGKGEAFCIGCNHGWVAVAKTGTTELECPKCKSMKGRFKFVFAPEEGTEVATCECGNQLYYLTRLGHMCANCGIYVRY